MQFADEGSKPGAREDALALCVARKMAAYEGTGPGLGIEIVDVRVGYAMLRMKIREDMPNGMGIAHGGMIFTLAGTAFSYACNSRTVGGSVLESGEDS